MPAEARASATTNDRFLMRSIGALLIARRSTAVNAIWQRGLRVALGNAGDFLRVGTKRNVGQKIPATSETFGAVVTRLVIGAP
jgi:hypothetical protein